MDLCFNKILSHLTIIVFSSKTERVTSVGIPRTDQEAEDSSTDSDDDEENEQTLPGQQDNQQLPHLMSSFTSYCEQLELPSSQQYYGFELKEPSTDDKKIYERYFTRFYCFNCCAILTLGAWFIVLNSHTPYSI